MRMLKYSRLSACLDLVRKMSLSDVRLYLKRIIGLSSEIRKNSLTLILALLARVALNECSVTLFRSVMDGSFFKSFTSSLVCFPSISNDGAVIFKTVLDPFNL